MKRLTFFSSCVLAMSLQGCDNNAGSSLPDADTAVVAGHNQPDLMTEAPDMGDSNQNNHNNNNNNNNNNGYPAFFPAGPVLTSSGGPIVASPVIIPITFAGDTMADDI